MTKFLSKLDSISEDRNDPQPCMSASRPEYRVPIQPEVAHIPSVILALDSQCIIGEVTQCTTQHRGTVTKWKLWFIVGKFH